MENVWGFLLQTLSVSAVALMLLIIKRLFQDKISPDVQYAFWMVLAMRILLPVRGGVSILFPIPVWMELLRAKAERRLDSVYSGLYEPIDNRHIFPTYPRMPVSVTDWLFVIYGIGIALVLLHYAIAYIRLRNMLRDSAADETVQARADAVAAAYGLRAVPVRIMSGVHSPFVCGVFSPVLVLPEGREISDSVLLHELLHRAHHDPAKNVIWCILRALHWCNPFMWYVVNRIENDLETCCDQRVLERLEGEARRDYGKTLLLMANDRYARMPGTSSISNGGRNIARRIEAIVRFQTYPKGVTFALVCMAVLLVNAAVSGQTVNGSDVWLRPAKERQLDYALAMSRVQRCSTLAGALDTYAKGIIYENGIYMAMASPLANQETLETAMREENADGMAAYHVERGFGSEDQMAVQESDGYRIYNLKKDADQNYEALLLFSGIRRADEGRNGSAENDAEADAADTACMLALPVRAYETDGSWVVERTGEVKVFPTAFKMGFSDDTLLPPLCSYAGNCVYGRVMLDVRTSYTIKGSMTGDEILPDAAFSGAMLLNDSVYDYRNAKAGVPGDQVSVIYVQAESEHAPLVYPAMYDLPEGDGGTGGTDGMLAWETHTVADQEPKGIVTSGWGGSMDPSQIGEDDGLPIRFGVKILWDGKQVVKMELEKQHLEQTDTIGKKGDRNGA